MSFLPDSVSLDIDPKYQFASVKALILHLQNLASTFNTAINEGRLMSTNEHKQNCQKEFNYQPDAHQQAPSISIAGSSKATTNIDAAKKESINNPETVQGFQSNHTVCSNLEASESTAVDSKVALVRCTQFFSHDHKILPITI